MEALTGGGCWLLFHAPSVNTLSMGKPGFNLHLGAGTFTTLRTIQNSPAYPSAIGVERGTALFIDKERHKKNTPLYTPRTRHENKIGSGVRGPGLILMPAPPPAP